MMTEQFIVVPVDVARAVLHSEGHYLGQDPGRFATRLIATIKAADLDNRAELARIYPAHVAAVLMAKTTEGLNGLAALVHQQLDAEARWAEVGRRLDAIAAEQDAEQRS